MTTQRHSSMGRATTMSAPVENADSSCISDNKRTIRALNQRLVVLGMLAFLTVGGAVAYFGYQNTMYLIDKAVGFVIRAETAQTPEQLAEYIKLTQDLIPAEGNPVWLFPTPKTDFGLIQANLDSIVLRANIASAMDPLSESYNIAIIDLHLSAGSIRTNLLEIIPYTYITQGNIVLAASWVAAIMAIFTLLKKTRTAKTAIPYRAV